LLVHLEGELAQRWQEGERPHVEEILADHPELRNRSRVLLHLICAEIGLRRERGEVVSPSELVQRFPERQEQVAILLDCHRLFDEPLSAGFPLVGERIGPFQLLAEIGRGAQSCVYLASQQTLSDRLVVLKFVPSETFEHLSLARLQHAHIVPLYSTHTDPEGNWLILCMPYLGSKSLADLLKGLRDTPVDRRTGRQLLEVLDQVQPGLPPLPQRGPAREFLSRISYTSAVCWIGACLADAVQYAHDHDLVHLDVKPSNVLVSANAQPMLLDFHLAQPAIHPQDAVPTWLGGTPGYMSPEQRQALEASAQGQALAVAVDARSDIYALGVLLCEALGANVNSTTACEVPTWNPHCRHGLADILSRCLATDPNQRYASAAALAEDLRCHLNDRPLRNTPNRSLLERWQKWRRRQPSALSRWLLAGASVTVLSMIVVLLIQFYHSGQKNLGINRAAHREGWHTIDHISVQARKHQQMGRALLRDNQYEQALAHFARALALEPEHFPFHVDYAICLYRDGRAAAAVQAFHRCIDLAPEHERAKCYVNRGLAYAMLKDEENALRDYDQALRLDPNLAAAYLNRGVLHFQHNRYARAQADWQQALQLGADDAEVLFNLALLHQARQEHAAALRCLERILQADPGNKKATALYARWRTQ
jgi:serine/threonine protein kinase/Flp pilus assembly protein TadD